MYVKSKTDMMLISDKMIINAIYNYDKKKCSRTSYLAAQKAQDKPVCLYQAPLLESLEELY